MPIAQALSKAVNSSQSEIIKLRGAPKKESSALTVSFTTAVYPFYL